MKVFDPEAMEFKLIQLNGELVDNEAQPQFLTFVRKCKVAYYRIPPEFRDFLMQVHQDSQIVGFEYDFDQAGLNFGVIVSDSDSDSDIVSVSICEEESEESEKSDEEETAELAE